MLCSFQELTAAYEMLMSTSSSSGDFYDRAPARPHEGPAMAARWAAARRWKASQENKEKQATPPKTKTHADTDDAGELDDILNRFRSLRRGTGPPSRGFSTMSRGHSGQHREVSVQHTAEPPEPNTCPTGAHTQYLVVGRGMLSRCHIFENPCHNFGQFSFKPHLPFHGCSLISQGAPSRYSPSYAGITAIHKCISRVRM
mmetsp:Transcript_4046/g.7543  ORF Transcript_4046/g.7543 Transcript_4046/m.7543 type:complete len:200 (+) Transcript_4046:592-1191(+)